MNNIRSRNHVTRHRRFGGTIVGSLIEVVLIAVVVSLIVASIPVLTGQSYPSPSEEMTDTRNPIFRMLMTSSGTQLWVQRGISEIHSIDLSTGHSRPIYQSSGSSIVTALVSEDGQTYLLSLDDREIVIFRQGEVLVVKRLSGEECGRMALSADGQSAALVHDLNRICCWNLATQDPTWLEIQLSEAINRVALDFHGQTMAVSTKSGALHLYDVKTGQRRQTLISGGSLIRDLVFSQDGSTLVLPCDDSIVAYDVDTGELTWRHPSCDLDHLTGLMMSSDGRRIAVSSLRSGIMILDVLNGQKLHELQPPFLVFHLAFARDSKVLYASDQHQVRTLSLSVDHDYRVLDII